MMRASSSIVPGARLAGFGTKYKISAARTDTWSIR
jgi:hypothetical protein